jgi:AcrR family transcriptional regulator
MSRPKNSDPAKTHEAIVESAVAVLETHGPTQVSLRRVAKESGLSMGTLTYYFSNRHELIEACLDVHYQHVQRGFLEFHAALTGGTVDARVIHEHVGRIIDIAFADRAFLQLRATSLGEMQRYHPTRMQAHLLPALEMATTTLADAIGAKPLDVRLAALTFNYAVARYAVLSDDELRLLVGIADLDRARAAVRDHLCAALCRTLGFE